MSLRRTCVLITTLTALSLTTTSSADDWYPSSYGADDTLGAINLLTPEKVVQAARLIRTGKTYPLGVVTGKDSPAYHPREYSMTVLQISDGSGTTRGTNKGVGNDDLLYTWMGIGSQIDGLGHFGIDHVYYNGNHAADFVASNGLTKLAIHNLPPIVTRGVLLDIAKLQGTEMLPAGTAINRKEIDAAAAAQNVTLETGDVVLLHTGWLQLLGEDNDRFMAGEPGIGVEGARYLADLGVVAVGADTWGLDVLPHEDPDHFFPAHQELLTKKGVYILETMNTRDLAADGVSEFLFVLGQPRFEGAVQAIINPVAIH